MAKATTPRIDKGLYWDRAWSLVSGCTPVSPGCDHCWSASEASMRQHQANPKIQARYGGLVNENGQFCGKVRCNEDLLELPLKTRNPTRWAIWTDLFHEHGPSEFVDRAFAMMALCQQHIFLVLTKRPQRMFDWFSTVDRFEVENPATLRPGTPEEMTRGEIVGMRLRGCNVPWRTKADYERKSNIGCDMQFNRKHWPLPNVWLGTTAEDQKRADERIPLLLQCPAAVRFVSCEPLLGPVDLRRIKPWHPAHGPDGADALGGGSWGHESVRRMAGDPDCPGYCNHSDAPRLKWVIAGGESGPGARPSHPAWFRKLRDDCGFAGVSFFFKQWGEWEPQVESSGPLVVSGNGSRARVIGIDGEPGHTGNGPYALMGRVGKRNAGCLLDGREWKEFPKQVTNQTGD